MKPPRIDINQETELVLTVHLSNGYSQVSEIRGRDKWSRSKLSYCLNLCPDPQEDDMFRYGTFPLHVKELETILKQSGRKAD